MASNKTLLMLPGDGIGPEVMREVRRVIDWMDKRRAVTFDVSEGKVGGAAIDADGTPLTDETMADAMGLKMVIKKTPSTRAIAREGKRNCQAETPAARVTTSSCVRVSQI